jgi:hypothetical protein
MYQKNEKVSKMKKKSKIILGSVLGGILLLVIVATLVIGNFFISYALVPNQGAEERDTSAEVLPQGVESQEQTYEEQINENRDEEFQAAEEWHDRIASNIHKVTITSEEGFTLAGHTYLQEDETNQWAVLAHGYQGTEEGMHPTARHYYEAGFNILTFDQRAMDESEGGYITMGIKESDDLILWLEALLTKRPNSEIVTHGVSMGAATVLMASGQANFPDAVKAVIADCGYSSVWGVFESELYQRFELPDFPFLHMAGLVGIPRAGINIFSEEGDVVSYTSQSETPTLFIHGTADDFVPYPMVYDLYQAHPGDAKELYSVEGAGHAEAQYMNPSDYFQKIFNFIG